MAIAFYSDVICFKQRLRQSSRADMHDTYCKMLGYIRTGILFPRCSHGKKRYFCRERLRRNAVYRYDVTDDIRLGIGYDVLTQDRPTVPYHR